MIVELDQYRLDLAAMEDAINEMKDSMEIPKTEEKIKELEELSAKEDIWNDMETSQKVLQEVKQLKGKVARYEKLKGDWEDMTTLVELAEMEEDESLIPEIGEGLKQ